MGYKYEKLFLFKAKKWEGRMATGITVEQRVVEEYQCPVADVLRAYASEGLTSKQVADILRCGVSNVRRIARKYQIHFNQPVCEAKIVHSKEFMDHRMNPVNFLSRAWGGATMGRKITSE